MLLRMGGGEEGREEFGKKEGGGVSEGEVDTLMDTITHPI